MTTGEHPLPSSRPEAPRRDSRKIVVVGPCASGKTTLVATLRGLGYDAHVSGQEHSEIANLWQRMKPDVLIALDADIAAVRARRGEHWPEWLHNVQVRRLQEATDAADLRLDTSTFRPHAVTAKVLAFLERRQA